MNADELHRDAVVNDGLIIANWSRGVCQDMRCGGWNEARTRTVIGGNWLALLDKVWKA